MIEDLMTFWLIVGLFISAAVLGILFLITYNKYYALKHDTSKTVVLRDFSGNKYKVGKYIGLGMTRPVVQPDLTKKSEEKAAPKGQKDIEPKPIIKVQTEKGETQHWIVDLPIEHSLVSVSIDYGDELMILTDFLRTDIERRVIAPMIDKSILELGLRRGVYAIIERNNTVVQQNEYLKKVVKEREVVIQKISIDFDAEQLDFITKSRAATKLLIDEAKKHFLQDIVWLKVRAQTEASKQLKGSDQLIQTELEKLDAEAQRIKLAEGKHHQEQELREEIDIIKEMDEKRHPKQKLDGKMPQTKAEVKDRGLLNE